MDDEPTLYISFHSEAKFIRMIDETFAPVTIKIDADIIPDDDAEVDQINDVFMRIKTWLDNILPLCVAFSAGNETAIDMFLLGNGLPRTVNTIMLTPGDPSDDILCAVFHAKFNAISEGIVEFINTKIESESDFKLSFCFEGNSNEVLPDHGDWLSNDTYYDKPWWNRNDGTMHDFPCEDSMRGIEPLWALEFVNLDDIQTFENKDTPKPKVQFTPIVLKSGKGGKRKP